MIVEAGGPTEIISARRSGCLMLLKSLVNTPKV